MNVRETWFGVKAGAVTGLLFGGFLVPALILTQQALNPPLIQGGLYSLSASNFVLIIILMIGSSAVFAAVILSLIGFLFVITRKWIPGDSLTKKTSVFFLILWLLAFVFRVPAYLRGLSLDLVILEGISLVWVLICASAFARFLARFSRNRG